jgi:hypothetical protein
MSFNVFSHNRVKVMLCDIFYLNTIICFTGRGDARSYGRRSKILSFVLLSQYALSPRRVYEECIADRAEYLQRRARKPSRWTCTASLRPRSGSC